LFETCNLVLEIVSILCLENTFYVSNFNNILIFFIFRFSPLCFSF